MKYFIHLLIILALCCVFGCSAKLENNKEISDTEMESSYIEIYFFHNTPCSTCNGKAEFYDIYNEELEDVDKEKYPAKVYCYNTFQINGQDKLKEIASLWGILPDDINEPAMLINGRFFNGLKAIEKNIREQYMLAWEDGDPTVDVIAVQKENSLTGEQLFEGWKTEPENQTVVYFYRTTCAECIETALLIDNIPKTMELNGEEVKINLVRLNTREGKNGQRASEFFRSYHVSEENQIVPIVFFRDSYLAGIDQISSELGNSLEEGAGLGFVWPQPDSEKVQ